MEAPQKKKQYTDEERLELASKLDKELDEFINNLPKKRYEDGWPEDRWEEEMEKHPFFMKKPPEPGDELHPLYEGLQKLKYDPEENEPEELATAYKDDGNFNFKHKNYRLAIISYTEGIKIRCGNVNIEANLLNNRAAAHFYLKNYRSSLRDCELALKLQPDYVKALNRAANCCFQLKQYEKAVEYCDKLLTINKNDGIIIGLRKQCVNEAKIRDRNQRKQKIEEKKRIEEDVLLVAAISRKGIQIQGGIDLELLEPKIPELMHHRVHFDENHNLIWPVVFLYPEYKIMDYIQEFNEKTQLIEMIRTIFSDFCTWDEEKKYKPDNINIYYETLNQKIITVSNNSTLEEILMQKNFVVKGGTPTLILLVKNSRAEQQFLAQY